MGRPATCLCGVCEKCQHRIYMRDWYRRTRKSYANPEKRRAYELHRYHTDPEYRVRHNARVAIAQRVRRGLVERQPCEMCGADQTVAHHEDYTKPFDVVWLCHACHNEIHGPAEMSA